VQWKLAVTQLSLLSRMLETLVSNPSPKSCFLLEQSQCAASAQPKDFPVQYFSLRDVFVVPTASLNIRK
jgi:hypothetical protein